MYHGQEKNRTLRNLSSAKRSFGIVNDYRSERSQNNYSSTPKEVRDKILVKDMFRNKFPHHRHNNAHISTSLFRNTIKVTKERPRTRDMRKRQVFGPLIKYKENKAINADSRPRVKIESSSGYPTEVSFDNKTNKTFKMRLISAKQRIQSAHPLLAKNRRITK